MSVFVTFDFVCGGCREKVTGERRMMTSEFLSFSGRSWGFGSHVQETPRPDPPEGWVSFDPYTGCCYCPECWASILEPSSVSKANA